MKYPMFKSRVVLELLSGEKTVAEACREYELTAQMVNDWKAQFLAAAPQAFEKGAFSSGEAERIAELEQMVGKLTMQLEIAKHMMRLSAWRVCGIHEPHWSASRRPLMLKWERCIPCF